MEFLILMFLLFRFGPKMSPIDPVSARRQIQRWELKERRRKLAVELLYGTKDPVKRAKLKEKLLATYKVPRRSTR
jgi:hypothetical protein